jgi:hypothetical protein
MAVPFLEEGLEQAGYGKQHANGAHPLNAAAG